MVPSHPFLGPCAHPEPLGQRGRGRGMEEGLAWRRSGCPLPLQGSRKAALSGPGHYPGEQRMLSSLGDSRRAVCKPLHTHTDMHTSTRCPSGACLHLSFHIKSWCFLATGPVCFSGGCRRWREKDGLEAVSMQGQVAAAPFTSTNP